MPAGQRDETRSPAQERAENHRSGFGAPYLKLPDGVRLFSVKSAGAIVIDILPYKVTLGKGMPRGNPMCAAGEFYSERTFYVHRNIGVEQQPYICPAKYAGQKCPVCAESARLRQAGGADNKKIADGLNLKERQLWNVSDLQSTDKSSQLWDQSFHLFGKQMDAALNAGFGDDGRGWYYHPTKGHNLRINFVKATTGTHDFYEAQAIDFRKRGNLDKSLMAKILDLDAILVCETSDRLAEIFYQSGGGHASADNAGGSGWTSAPAASSPAAAGGDDWGDDASTNTAPAAAPAATTGGDDWGDDPAVGAPAGAPAAAPAPAPGKAPAKAAAPALPPGWHTTPDHPGWAFNDEGEWKELKDFPPPKAAAKAPGKAPGKRAAKAAAKAAAPAAEPPAGDDWGDAPATGEAAPAPTAAGGDEDWS